jgi:hypothetical protein
MRKLIGGVKSSYACSLDCYTNERVARQMYEAYQEVLEGVHRDE